MNITVCDDEMYLQLEAGTGGYPPRHDTALLKLGHIAFVLSHLQGYTNVVKEKRVLMPAQNDKAASSCRGEIGSL